MDDQKLSAFTHGIQRKSKKEKEKEAADLKKKEEEELAAKAYTDFIDAFEGEGASRKDSGRFVRAESKTAYAPSSAKGHSSSRQPRAFDEDMEVRPALHYYVKPI